MLGLRLRKARPNLLSAGHTFRTPDSRTSAHGVWHESPFSLLLVFALSNLEDASSKSTGLVVLWGYLGLSFEDWLEVADSE